METEGEQVQKIYYGRLSSEATEGLLGRFGQDGSFMLRDSGTVQGAFCLCVRKSPYVHTYRLVHATAGWSLQGDSGIRLQTFRTLAAMIESFQGGAALSAGVVPLGDPLDKTQLQNSLGAELDYIEMCGSSDFDSAGQRR
ncbi:SH2 domain-containing protein 1A-like [Aulostomus maculatus]